MKSWLKTVLFITVPLVFVIGAVAWSDDDDDDDRDDERELVARLSGYQEVLPISTVARGEFKGRLSRRRLAFTLRYSGLETHVRFAHIHFGQVGVNGNVMTFLCGGGNQPAPCPEGSGIVRGVIEPADILGSAATQGIAAGEFREFLRAIRAGRGYANVHTDAYPGGEIRGQIDVDDD